MRLKFVCILFAAVLAGQLIAADVQSGRAAYLRTCKVCHGPDGEGNPVIAKALKVTLPSLASAQVQSKTDEQIKKIMAEGTGKMKPQKQISTSEANDITAFLRSLAKK